MSFWKQLREAVRLEIEDFFDVKWQAVTAMSLVVALLLFSAYWHTTHLDEDMIDPALVLALVVLWSARRSLKL